MKKTVFYCDVCEREMDRTIPSSYPNILVRHDIHPLCSHPDREVHLCCFECLKRWLEDNIRTGAYHISVFTGVADDPPEPIAAALDELKRRGEE